MNRCAVCCCCDFESIYESRYNFSITSDNKQTNKGITVYRCRQCGHLQKFSDKYILSNIYNNYAVDSLSDNARKTIGHKSRYEMLCENIADFIPKQGNILDVGTGSGAMLQSLAFASGESSLYGFDLTDKFADTLAIIPHFVRLFTDIDAIGIKFDLITVVHTLEHIADTQLFLQNLKSILKQDGVLLIQVPDIEKNVFDIFVYDHISHFCINTLAVLMSRFFTHLMVPEKTIDKEITLLCANSISICSDNLLILAQSQYNNFNFTIFYENIFEKLECHNGRLAVFGTSPICAFFALILGVKLAYFLDEDAQRHGKIHFGVPILPIECYDGIDVVLPFTRDATSAIKTRFSKINFIDLWSL